MVIETIGFRQIVKTGGSWAVYTKDAFKKINAKKGDFVKVETNNETNQIIFTLQE